MYTRYIKDAPLFDTVIYFGIFTKIVILGDKAEKLLALISKGISGLRVKGPL